MRHARGFARTTCALFVGGLLLAGCGGGGSGSSGGDTTPVATVKLSGVVSKGPVTNAQITIYNLNSDGSRGSKVAGPFASSADGSWSGDIPQSATGPFEVVATSGSYVDEASGATVTLGTGEEMRSLIRANPGTTVTATITPYTHAMALAAAEMIKGGASSTAAVAQTLDNAKNVFGFDPTQVTPPDPLNVPATASSEQKQYAALLGGISNLGNDTRNGSLSSASRLELTLALAEDMADGKFDGKGVGGSAISVGGNPLPAKDNAGLGALVTHTNTFSSSQGGLSGTTLSGLNGDLTTQPVADTTAPVVKAPAAITVQAASGATSVPKTNAAIAAFLSGATASDEVDGNLSAKIAHDAPADFPIGSTTVTFSAKDSAGNTGKASSTVTVTAANAATYSVGGSVAGLGTGVSVNWEIRVNGIFNNDGGSPNGNFTATTGLVTGNSYALTVNGQPNGYNCAVQNGSGTIANANITNVQINCAQNASGGGANLVDFPALAFTPSAPTLPAAAAPAAPIDVRTDINGLYTALAAAEKAAIFAPAPQGVISRVQYATNFDEKTYTLVQTDNQIAAAATWARSINYRYGPDNLPLTADDQPTGWTAAPHGPAGPTYGFDHPGADATWFTADDRPAGSNAVYIPATMPLEHSGGARVLALLNLRAGNDGELFTADDTVSTSTGYSVIAVDGNGNRGQVTHFNGAGTDGLWFTADDKVLQYTVVRFNAGGASLQATTYNTAGTNGTWFDGDDKVMHYTLTAIDAGFRPTAIATFNNAGQNGTWFDGDDLASGYSFQRYDAAGNLVLLANHTGKGTDQTWFTADDQTSGTLTVYDANGHETAVAGLTSNFNGTAVGSDGIWVTGDDNVSFWTYMAWNANGKQTRNAQFTAKGTDGKWFTADDVPNTWNYWQKTYDAAGNTILSVNYSGPGPDGKAFSTDDVVSNYTASLYEGGTLKASAYVSNFGNDGLPFTSDDSTWPWGITTVSGSQKTTVSYAGTPGADGQFFTADDPSSSRTVATLDAGGNAIEAVTYDGSNAVIGYQKAINQDSFGFDYVTYADAGADNDWMTVADNGVASYQAVSIDQNGRPTQYTSHDTAGADQLWFTADDTYTQIDYMQIDGNGRYTLSGYSYPGSDAIWNTADDYTYYQTMTYDGAGVLNQVTYYYSAGQDGIWMNADDPIDSISYPQPVAMDAEATAGNSGFAVSACNPASSASGSISVQVNDRDGQPLAGAIVQLDQAGATATSDATGLAALGTVGGSHDVHVFMDNYSWESFYCVEANGALTLQARLQSRTSAPTKSFIPLNLTVNNKDFSNRTQLALLDSSTGALIAKYVEGDANSWAMELPVPAGTTINGDLWAFEFGWYGSTGKIFDAVQLVAGGSWTTAADTLVKHDYTVDYNVTKPDRDALAQQGSFIAPAGYAASPAMLWGEVLSFPFVYEYAPFNGYMSTAPIAAVMPTALSIDGLGATGFADASGFDWSYRQPLTAPQLPLTASAESGLLRGPRIQTQQSGTVQWLAPAQTASGAMASVVTLTLHGYIPAIQSDADQWVLHAPAGAGQLVLPTVPAAITVQNLSAASTQMAVQMDAVHGTSYQALLAGDLHQGLPADAVVERFSYNAGLYFTP